MVNPCTPNACNAAFTSSSLNGLMTAVMSFIAGCPFRQVLSPTFRCGRFAGGAAVCRRGERGGSCVTSVFQIYAGRLRAGRLANNGVDEGFGVERGQVIGPLAQADEFDRNAELSLDGDDDPAPRGPVELGQHDAGD